ncbi:hypothetical protein T492DRAFT_501984 [Pavlovales sp. CCMP2436]|nr:hypothetical protein T492DRAFT_501984 [Pavlovales sp. CCMP2436]
MRLMLGAFGAKAIGGSSVAFVSAAAVKADVRSRYGLFKHVEAVRDCRSIGKKDMIHNSATPDITVDPETFEVSRNKGCKGWQLRLPFISTVSSDF